MQKKVFDACGLSVEPEVYIASRDKRYPQCGENIHCARSRNDRYLAIEHRDVLIILPRKADAVRSNGAQTNLRPLGRSHYYGKEKEGSKKEEGCEEAPLTYEVIRKSFAASSRRENPEP